MTTPCYYCERPEDHCKSCIHSDTYEEPKPLSDEEMIKTINSYATGWFSDKFEKGVFITEEAMIKFARAIEERHGIK